jgi:hypothetical protein
MAGCLVAAEHFGERFEKVKIKACFDIHLSGIISTINTYKWSEKC